MRLFSRSSSMRHVFKVAYILMLCLLCCSSAFISFASANEQANGPAVLFISGSHSNAAKIKLLQREADDYGYRVVLTTAADLREQNLDQDALAAVFDAYKLVVFDGVSSRDNQQSFASFLPALAQSQSRFMAMTLDEAYLQNLSAATAKTLSDYYRNGGKRNFDRLLEFLRYRIIDQNQQQAILPPVIFPGLGIYHPDYPELIFGDRESYFSWLESKGKNDGSTRPVVGILLQRASIEIMQTLVIDEIIKRLEAQGATVLPFYFELSPFARDYTALIQDADQSVVDIIINFRLIHWANKRRAEFESLGVPVLQALTYFDGDQTTWEADIQGISPGMTPFTLVLPESAGVIDPLTVATMEGGAGDMNGSDNFDGPQVKIIDYQLDHMVTKALRMVSLKYKPNAEKKFTVMVWGDEDMGASFMNVPDSLHTIAHRLNAEGYNVEPYEHDYYSDRAKAILEPFYRNDRLGENIDTLLADGLAELLSLDEYFKWFNNLPANVTEPVMDYWGHPKKSFMAVERNGEDYLLIPRIRNGNMLVMRQPPRADDKEQAERIYHDETVPINHFYLAGYYYAREYWNSDAIIHLGTHGSQEYLYGKERVPSIYDHPNLAVWDTPILYPFIVDDVGEAMQTKRRGRATVISHMTPPFAASGLQGVLSDIHNLMHDYSALDEGGVKVKAGQQIVETCYANNICEDMELTREQIDADFEGFLTQLHEYMNELAGLSQPLGLHSYGELPRKELVISTISQMLGADFLTEAVKFERKAYKVNSHHGGGHDDHDDHHSHGDSGEHSHDDAQDHSHDDDHAKDDGHDGRGFHESQSELSQLTGFKTVRDYIVYPVDQQTREAESDHHGEDKHLHGDGDDHAHHHDNEDHEHGFEPPIAFEKMSDEMQSLVKKGQGYYRNMLAIQELDNTVAFLNGEYIPVTTGGDPIRHPDSLPTGFNLYGFDPSRIPTKAAYEQGAELVEQMIADYYNDNGRYPDKLAFTLWSIETMRQYGVLEGQALHAMGMRPVWSPDGRVVDSEIIPFAELKRPRVDVVLSTTGLYRDAFPNIIQYLAKAIEKIAALKEEGNNIWLNSQRIADALKAEGVESEEAEYLSSVRLFSNAPGQHGSGVDDATFASDTWEEDKQISDIFLNNMGYYYGSDNSRYGKKLEGVNLFAKQLSGTDIALHSRSSNLYGMLSTDDPFEYFGALSMAVRNLDGKSPQMMINNLRNPSQTKAESASKFLSKELRTRNFHPRWITEMMEEGYSGAVEMSGRIDNFWGWQVVDPNVVREDQWQAFFDVYVEDSLELGVQEFFEQVNPEAQARMLERMIEAIRKDYWEADESTLSRIIERYSEIVEQHDHYVDNEKLREFVNASAAGFGLAMQLPPPDLASSDVAAAAPQAQAVEGQQLEKVAAQSSDSELNKVLVVALLLTAMLLLGGGLYQWRRPS